MDKEVTDATTSRAKTVTYGQMWTDNRSHLAFGRVHYAHNDARAVSLVHAASPANQTPPMPTNDINATPGKLCQSNAN